MKRLFIVVFLIVLTSFVALAQNPPNSQYVPGMVMGNDTLPHVDLPSVLVFPRTNFKSKVDEKQYWRLVWRVKKVLPYAKEAAALLRKYEMEVPPEARGKDRRMYVRKAEDMLMKRYGPELKQLSINDGKVLIKLIDRETHQVSYDIIHDLKGGFQAAFWQGIARIFGNNLKSEYDPNGEDRQIEQIVQYIEMGAI